MPGITPGSTSLPSPRPALQLYRDLDPQGKSAAAAAKAAEAKARAALPADRPQETQATGRSSQDGQDQGPSPASEQPAKPLELADQVRSLCYHI